MRSILPILILISSTFCKYHQKSELPTYGVFWKITGNGLKNTSYLLGTYHDAGGKQILDSIKIINSILTESEQFICESIIDFSNFDTPTAGNQISKISNHLKPWPVADSTYDNLLSEKQRIVYDSVISTDKFLQFVQQANYRPLAMLNKIKYSLNNNKKTKVKLKDILDLDLQNQAKKNGLNIIGLESREEIQSITDSLNSFLPLYSYKDEIDLLMNYIENHSRIDSLTEIFMHKALKSYLEQDLEQLMKMQMQQNNDISLTENSLSITPKLKKYVEIKDELMIDKRNKDWLKKIPSLIENKSSFIAVGAGHLGGSDGIINQLRLLGYQVEQVKNE